MLDDGVDGAIGDLAKVKGIVKACNSPVLLLMLLAPEIVEAIVDGGQPAELQLDDLLEGFPLDWEGQRTSGRAPPRRTAFHPLNQTHRRIAGPPGAPGGLDANVSLLRERRGSRLQPSDLPILQCIDGKHGLPRPIGVVVH